MVKNLVSVVKEGKEITFVNNLWGADVPSGLRKDAIAQFDLKSQCNLWPRGKPDDNNELNGNSRR